MNPDAPRTVEWPVAPDAVSPARLALDLVAEAGFEPVGSATDVAAGRGVFSSVLQVAVREASVPSVVVKAPLAGPDGDSARLGGGCRREALAYTTLLPPTGVRRPACHLVADHGDGGYSFVLEDLGRLRMGDQAAGLDRTDALAMVSAIGAWHRSLGPELAAAVDLRRNTPATLPLDALRAGLDCLSRFGPGHRRRLFAAVLDRREELIEAFDAGATAVITHGDPRADNAAFDPAGNAVLFDFQQLAVQLAEADLAWLAATSLLPADRRDWERDLIERYRREVDPSIDPSETLERYRLGLLLPASAVLLLVQREVAGEASAAMVRRSLDRISTALLDHDLPGWGR